MSPWNRSRRERELDEEIRTHIEMAIEERVARGESRTNAERAVRREFGDPGRVKEVTRSMWGGLWMDRLVQDLRFGIRSLFRDPGFSLAATLVLIVGIGANAIVFSIVDRVLLEAPPEIEDPEALVGLRWVWEDGIESSWSYTDYDFVREESDGFAEILAYRNSPIATSIGMPDGAIQADAWIVSDNFFQTLGIGMTLGRSFLPEEGVTPNAKPVAILDHGFWLTRFAGDPGIVGRAVSLNGTPFTVVGVAPREFRGISPYETPPDLYVPIMMQGVLLPGWDEFFERRMGEMNSWLRVVGRRDAGLTPEAAQARMDALAAHWNEEFGSWAASNDASDFRMVVSSDYRFAPGEGPRVRRTFFFLAMVVGAVLLVGCANLAVLLLARASDRQGEMSVRVALGAGRGRLLRQLLTESLVLAAVGGLGGYLVALWGTRLVSSLLTAPAPAELEFGPDGTVLLFAGALTLLVTGIFGLAPALWLARSDLASTLRKATRSTRRNRVRSILVVGQVAIAVVLVTGARLFIRSVVAAQSVELGFETEGRFVTSVRLGSHGYDAAEARVFIEQALSRLRALPGVAAAAVTSRPPLQGRWSSTTGPIGTQYENSGIDLDFSRAGTGYFEAMGISILEGRTFSESDQLGGPPSFVISETAANRFWPGESAVGKAFRWRDEEWTVVGVTEDSKYYEIGEDPVGQVFIPDGRDYTGTVVFVVHAVVPPETIFRAVESAIHGVDPNVALFGTRTVAELVEAQTSPYRAMAVLVGIFGGIALFLAAVGLYGIQAYLVGQRSKEIGIRIALGAKARGVALRFFGRGSALAGVGVGVGVLTALALGRIVQGMLFGVESQDPVTFVIVVSVLLVVSLAASFFPALRASRMDPMLALREE